MTNRTKPLGLYLLLLFFIVLTFFPQVRNTLVFQSVSQVVLRGMVGLEWISDRVVSWGSGTLRFFQDQQVLLAEQDRLRLLIGKAEARLQTFDTLLLENTRLRQALGFYAPHPYKRKLRPVQVVTHQANAWFDRVAINRGAVDGLRAGLPVVDAEGLVGRIAQVFPHRAQVLLLTDPTSSVSVMHAASGEVGVARGDGSPLLTLDYLLSDSPVQVGDVIVTSGSSDFYPRGLVVGTVASVAETTDELFAKVRITPAVRFTASSQLFVWMP